MSSYKIAVTVKEIKGVCDMHRVGDKVEIVGDSVSGRICTMALHTIFPFVFAMQYGSDFPWLKDKDVGTAYCPDPLGLVLFEMKRSKLDD